MVEEVSRLHQAGYADFNIQCFHVGREEHQARLSYTRVKRVLREGRADEEEPETRSAS
jgi:hypothetical protein